MEDQGNINGNRIADDEKLSLVMVYTNYLLCWGEVITKELIRVSTWLRTNAAPDHITLYNARVLQVQQSAPQKPIGYREMHVPLPQITAFHLMPPNHDPLDYDPRDGLRKLEPITVMVGPYKFDGNLLIAEKATVQKYLEVTKETFTSLYDAEITYPMVTTSGKLKVPFLIFRFNDALLASSTTPEQQ